MAIEKFKSYVTPVPVLGHNAHHTYVKFDQGTAFGCFGTTEKGKELKGTSGSMDLNLAHTLHSSLQIPIFTLKHTHFPWGTQTLAKRHLNLPWTVSIPSGDAGILYLVNGVCQMASNRTMAPSKLTVKNANGYAALCAIYGTYGTNTFFNSAMIEKYIGKVLTAIGAPGFLKDATYKAIKIAMGGSNIIPAMTLAVGNAANSAWRQRLKNLKLDSQYYMKNYGVVGEWNSDEPSYDSLPLFDKIGLLYHPENIEKNADLPAQEYELVLRDILGESLSTNNLTRLQQCRQDFIDSLQGGLKIESPSSYDGVSDFSDQSDLPLEGLPSSKEITDEMNLKVNHYLEHARQELKSDKKFEQLFNIQPGQELHLFFEDQFELSLQNISDSIAKDEKIQNGMKDFAKAMKEAMENGENLDE